MKSKLITIAIATIAIATISIATSVLAQSPMKQIVTSYETNRQELFVLIDASFQPHIEHIPIGAGQTITNRFKIVYRAADPNPKEKWVVKTVYLFPKTNSLDADGNIKTDIGVKIVKSVVTNYFVRDEDAGG